MTFQSLQNNKSGSSPAVELHLRYGKLTNGKSKITDWRNLLQRAFSFEELSSLINWLEVHRAGAFPSSTTIIRNIKDMLAESKNDPVACRVPVTQEALDVWEIICHAGCQIDPEYIQELLNTYREYLRTNPPWYAQLTAATEFCHDWFVLYARYGSPRMRRFSTDHPKFLSYIELVKRASERG